MLRYRRGVGREWVSYDGLMHLPLTVGCGAASACELLKFEESSLMGLEPSPEPGSWN